MLMLYQRSLISNITTVVVHQIVPQHLSFKDWMSSSSCICVFELNICIPDTRFMGINAVCRVRPASAVFIAMFDSGKIIDSLSDGPECQKHFQQPTRHMTAYS